MIWWVYTLRQIAVFWKFDLFSWLIGWRPSSNSPASNVNTWRMHREHSTLPSSRSVRRPCIQTHGKMAFPIRMSKDCGFKRSSTNWWVRLTSITLSIPREGFRRCFGFPDWVLTSNTDYSPSPRPIKYFNVYSPVIICRRLYSFVQMPRDGIHESREPRRPESRTKTLDLHCKESNCGWKFPHSNPYLP